MIENQHNWDNERLTMTSWQTDTLEANGIRLGYTRTGGAKPPLVLAHGVTDNGLCWTPVAAMLAPDYDVIMVDARGHGRSEAPEQGYDPATQAADLTGVIAALGLHKPFVMGHSMGAVTALTLAGLYPDVSGAIVLEDPPAWWIGVDEHRLADMQTWFAGLKHKTRAPLIAEQRAAAPTWSVAELEPWAEAKLQVSPHVLSVFDPQTQRAADWPAVLGSITCPTLLITADPALGAALTAQGVASLQAFVPQLQVAHIGGAGHNIRREQFDRFLEVVQTFLASVSQNLGGF